MAVDVQAQRAEKKAFSPDSVTVEITQEATQNITVTVPSCIICTAAAFPLALHKHGVCFYKSEIH